VTRSNSVILYISWKGKMEVIYMILKLIQALLNIFFQKAILTNGKRYLPKMNTNETFIF